LSPSTATTNGDLAAGVAKEATSAGAAERGARELGAVAFSRAGDPSTGEFDAVIVAQFGDVDLTT
jgi:hypothetical protein